MLQVADGSWTNLGAKTTSATKEVSSATRGTRKYRVVVGHATASSLVSEEPTTLCRSLI